ncbi:MAG: aromatic ring-hydroxylating dioxygenase subunit alpha [Immundisolibacteraceae bacterium]|nr:aromatic ring-hydroxylating dioxygenase subunit alpha [Immundisolibacteraceae bacterium]
MDMRTRRPFPADYHDYVNTEEGWVDRRIFWEEEIYQQELEKIFARSWHFIAHDSQIPKTGDFVTTYMGEDGVIGVRDKGGQVRVFLNSCPHRGNKVCYADSGNSKNFTCNYHGWAFGMDGSLLGIHNEHIYEGDINKADWGLREARVSTYKGLVFANFDVEAPELDDWLGDYRWYLDMLLDNEEGGIEFLPGTIKSYVNANWKFGVENFIGDSLHAMWTHDSGAKAMMGGEPFPPADQTGSYHGSANGHGWEFGTDGIADIAILGQPEVIEYYESIRPKMRERLGEMRAKIFGSLASAAMFPNISFLPGLGTFRVWLPRGPRKMELRIWTIVNKNMPDHIKQLINKGTMLTFAPGGTLEMDDGENWEGNTQTNKGVITRQGKLHYGCGTASRIDHPEIPGIVHHGQYNDANQLAFYQRWADLMNADSWEDVPQRHEPRFAGKPTR